MTLLENEPVRAIPSPRALFVLYTGCGGNRAAPSSRIESRKEEERVETRFQGCGMVVLIFLYHYLLSLSLSLLFFAFSFRPGWRELEIETRSSGFNCACKRRVSRGRTVKIVLLSNKLE